ncbi:restriction endonuclease subunit S, partial [Akkermansiaceae bacterium]|nr:restriction endonuclease subunit S [Akkermansiaceae bacterium]
QKALNGILIPVPPIETQKQIVRSLHSLEEQTKRLEALYTQKLNDLKELKQSLLQQAFAGELTKEDAA